MGYSMTLNQLHVLNSLDGQDRYGLEIMRHLKAEHNISLILGSLYNVLGKLERDGLVESYFGEATEARGGRRKRFYRISALGERSLQEVRLQLQSSFNFQIA